MGDVRESGQDGEAIRASEHTSHPIQITHSARIAGAQIQYCRIRLHSRTHTDFVFRSNTTTRDAAQFCQLRSSQLRTVRQLVRQEVLLLKTMLRDVWRHFLCRTLNNIARARRCASSSRLLLLLVLFTPRWNPVQSLSLDPSVPWVPNPLHIRSLDPHVASPDSSIPPP